MEAKLALEYTFTFEQGSSMSIEAGYRFYHYFNAIETIRFVNSDYSSHQNPGALVRLDNGLSFSGAFVTLRARL